MLQFVTGQTKDQEMATKQQVLKALNKLAAELHQQPGIWHYDDYEMIAPAGKFWAGNLSQVYAYEYDSDMMSKSEFWDEIMIDIEQGLIDQD
jgi:hypothetical protein